MIFRDLLWALRAGSRGAVARRPGEGNRATAERLGVAECTVELHLTRLFPGVGARSRTELVNRARERGWLA